MYWMRRVPHADVHQSLRADRDHDREQPLPGSPSAPTHEREEIPIGQGCDGEELLVLDDDLQAGRGPGEIGELYISGPGLSPGYWRDPERTAAAFVANPLGSDVRATGSTALVIWLESTSREWSSWWDEPTPR